MQISIDNPVGAPQPFGPYSQVARVEHADGGVLLYVSGQCAEGDGTAAQSRGVFEALRLLLAAHGAGLDDIINIRTYLTDMDGFADYAAVRKEFLTGTPPTSTTVAVSRLVPPRALVEVEVVAAVGTGGAAAGGAGAQ
ncbi:RidA family protein [Streptomyces atriruber]|uniref:RidA family protein n=1 Tax=Streptomyces atriruber TaxID=545121 RepID=UPI0006E17079|nr:RidA family protein [Streptomyces atriruber]